MENILQPVGGSRRPIEPHSLHAPNAAPQVRRARDRGRGPRPAPWSLCVLPDVGFPSFIRQKKHAGLLNANSFAQSGVCSGRRQRPARRQRHGISHDPLPDARRFPGPCRAEGQRPPPLCSATGGHGDGSRGPIEPHSLHAPEVTSCRPQVMRARAGELPWPHNPAILTIVAVAHDCKAARGRLHDHFASYQI